MPASLKIVQLNIEGSKHLDLVIPFLKEQEPDVVCLQELPEPEVARVGEVLGMRCSYAAMSIDQGAPTGVGIFSKKTAVSARALQYGGHVQEQLLEYIHGNRVAGYHSSKFFLAMADIEKDGEMFRIGTTHFPVTSRGEASDYQQESMRNMLKLLAEEGEFVLTGDFNAPRGGEIFAELASRYKDNIPSEITTSIDGSLHRAGQLPHMVDGIFSTQGYTLSNVVGHTGVSDHWAFTAEVSKTRK